MLDLADILDFFDVPTGDAFDVSPEEAVAFFGAKGLRPTFSYADMIGKAHDHSFTVAKMMDVDMLSQIRASLDSAMANGTPFREWADTITPILQSGGWWGRKEVVDPLTGAPMIAQLGSPWRLETIFRTNMQSSYAAGAWQEIAQQAEFAPFLMYDAVDDLRTRPLHASWDRKILPVDSKWWKTHYPPNGYNCRCGVIQLDQEQVDALGMEVAKNAPSDGTYQWTNPRTGKKVAVPNGIDAGFDHNAGMTYEQDMANLLAEKVAALDAEQMAAAQAALAKQAAFKAEVEASTAKAQKAVAAAAGEAALARSLAKVQETAAQWSAQQQIDAIAKGKEAAGKGAEFKIKALKNLNKADWWAGLKPTEQIAAINELAEAYKAEQALAVKIYDYKKAVLAGKIPQPAMVKAFNSLPEEKKVEVLKAIEAAKEKAAVQATAATKTGVDPQAATAAAAGDGAPNPAKMVVVARKTKGGTAGAVYQDTDTGAKWMVKFNGSEDAVRNEVLASKLYNAAGVEAPDLHAIVIEGKPALASRMVDGISEVDAATLAKTASVQEGFAVDAWLANWDVAGMHYDNTVLIGGRALRIDVGGALRYRAVGGLKGAAFGDVVGEFESLLDRGMNRQSADVFGNITEAQIEAGALKVLRVRDDEIRALVARYGPTDPGEATALADRLIARKANVARRFPKAAEIARMADSIAGAEKARPPRVTAAEQEMVEQARVNGFGFQTDSDQIEDNMVVVHAYKNEAGEAATRGWLKMMPTASMELYIEIQKSAGTTQFVSFSESKDSILNAIKTINSRTENGQFFDAKVVQRIQLMQKAVSEMEAEVAKAVAATGGADDIVKTMQELKRWSVLAAEKLADAKAGARATGITGIFPHQSFPGAASYSTPGIKSGGVEWKKVDRTYEYPVAEFSRSFAKETPERGQVKGANTRYEATLPDGTRIEFFPHQTNVAFAMQGVVKIDVPGSGVASTERIFGAMSDAGIKSERAAILDRQHLYLNAFARIHLLMDAPDSARKAFDAITDRTEAALKSKLRILSDVTGVDIEKSDGWASVDGVRQAFGHGRAYQLRPDIGADEVDKMDKTHVLYHNPSGLSWSAGRDSFDRLKPVIEGGGVFASLTDRVRRGVPLSGSSVGDDLASGGGDYHFTRIATRGTADGTGVYWKVGALRRMDAITYTSDRFGRTTGDTVFTGRKGQTIKSLKDTAYGSGGGSTNETIFKAGLSIFDGLDRIVLYNKTEVAQAIKWMKERGYKTWPDGRQLEEVIITKEKHVNG